MTTRRAWRLRARPEGAIKDGDLELVDEPLPGLEEGQVLVEVNYLSVDPTNRIWMSDMESYMPPVAIGDIMRSGVAGTVVESKSAKFPVGMHVSGLAGWATHVVVNADQGMLAPLPAAPGVPMAKAFGSLGLTALTAYFGLLDIGEPKSGDVLVVSAACGATGSVVGQIGKIHGCRTIGIAGGERKCKHAVEELGFDACIDYKNEDVGARLDELCPEGIDINFENVGGEIMEAVMARMKNFGRMVLCGMISMYNASGPVPGPRTFPLILMKRLKVQGFIVLDSQARNPEALAKLTQWVTEGKIRTHEDVRPGIENAVATVKQLFVGGNLGKLLVEVKPP